MVIALNLDPFHATEYKYTPRDGKGRRIAELSPLFLETASAASSFLDVNKSTSDGKKCTPHRPRRKTPTRKEFAADLSSERKSSSTQSERERKKTRRAEPAWRGRSFNYCTHPRLLHSRPLTHAVCNCYDLLSTEMHFMSLLFLKC
jgi:hypothetical protein